MSSNRARTRERRKQREQERQRNRRMFIIGAVVIIAVFAAVLVIVSNQPAEAPVSDVLVARYKDIPQSVNSDGFPVLGNPDAPVKVVEYASFDCPHCGEFADGVAPTLVDRARAGDISFTYVPMYGTGGIPNGEGAARAAVCAGAQGDFWVYEATLFSWQATYGNQALAGNRLSSLANNLGLDMGTWNACLNSDSTNALLVAANGAASSLEGFTGTPTVTVDGTIVQSTLTDITDAIDAALAAAPAPAVQPTAAPAETTPEATSEATTEATAEATPEVTAATSQ